MAWKERIWGPAGLEEPSSTDTHLLRVPLGTSPCVSESQFPHGQGRRSPYTEGMVTIPSEPECRKWKGVVIPGESHNHGPEQATAPSPPLATSSPERVPEG